MRFFWVLFLVMSISEAYAQSLSDQISAMRSIQNETEAETQARERQLAQQRAVVQKQKDTERLADKQRDQAYEDKLRDLEVQHRTLKVEEEKARVARTNDIIDQELRSKDADADVARSQADAIRNVSSGAKIYMEKSGEAKVEHESGMFK